MAAAKRLRSCAQHEIHPGGESPLRNLVVGTSSKPQRKGREAKAEGSGEQKLWVDEQKPDPRRCIPGQAGERPRSSHDQRGVAYIRRPCSEGCISYLGRSRLMPERATRPTRSEAGLGLRPRDRKPLPERQRSEKSAEAIVAAWKPNRGRCSEGGSLSAVKGQTERRAKRP